LVDWTGCVKRERWLSVGARSRCGPHGAARRISSRARAVRLGARGSARRDLAGVTRDPECRRQGASLRGGHRRRLGGEHRGLEERSLRVERQTRLEWRGPPVMASVSIGSSLRPTRESETACVGISSEHAYPNLFYSSRPLHCGGPGPLGAQRIAIDVVCHQHGADTQDGGLLALTGREGGPIVAAAAPDVDPSFVVGDEHDVQEGWHRLVLT
jgi:hypothetical protein